MVGGLGEEERVDHIRQKKKIPTLKLTALEQQKLPTRYHIYLCSWVGEYSVLNEFYGDLERI